MSPARPLEPPRPHPRLRGHRRRRRPRRRDLHRRHPRRRPLCARAPRHERRRYERKLIARLVAADGRARLVCAWGIPGLERLRPPRRRRARLRPHAADRAAPQRRRVAVPELGILGRHAAHRRVLLAQPGATEAYQHAIGAAYSLRPPSAPRPPAGGSRCAHRGALRRRLCRRVPRGLPLRATAAGRHAAGTARARAPRVGGRGAPLSNETLYALLQGRPPRRRCTAPGGSTRRCTSMIRRAGGCRASSDTLSSLTTRTRRRRLPRSDCRRAQPRAATAVWSMRRTNLQRGRRLCALARLLAADRMRVRDAEPPPRARRRRRARVRDGGDRRRTIELDSGGGGDASWVRRGGAAPLLDRQPQTARTPSSPPPSASPATGTSRAATTDAGASETAAPLPTAPPPFGRRRPAGGDQPRDRPARVWRQQERGAHLCGLRVPAGGERRAAPRPRRRRRRVRVVEHAAELGFDRPLDRRSVAGWWRGAALRVGAGRVVVMCDQSWPSSAAFLKAVARAAPPAASSRRTTRGSRRRRSVAGRRARLEVV